MNRLTDHVNFEQRLTSEDDMFRTHKIFYQNRCHTAFNRVIVITQKGTQKLVQFKERIGHMHQKWRVFENDLTPRESYLQESYQYLSNGFKCKKTVDNRYYSKIEEYKLDF